MKNLIPRIAVGVTAGLFFLALWRLGMLVGSLMTVRTPLYFTVHEWASAIVCMIIGVMVAVYSGQESSH